MFKKLDFEYGGYLSPGKYEVKLTASKDGSIIADYRFCEWDNDEKLTLRRTLSKDEINKVNKLIEECMLCTWNKTYQPEGDFILDGYFWNVFLEDNDEESNFESKYVLINGHNAYPWCFYKLIRAIIVAAPEFKDTLEHFTKEKSPVYKIEPLYEFNVKI